MLVSKAAPKHRPDDYLTYITNPGLSHNSLLFGKGYKHCFINVDPRNEELADGVNGKGAASNEEQKETAIPQVMRSAGENLIILKYYIFYV